MPSIKESELTHVTRLITQSNLLNKRKHTKTTYAHF
jgi:hypothetical protein